MSCEEAQLHKERLQALAVSLSVFVALFLLHLHLPSVQVFSVCLQVICRQTEEQTDEDLDAHQTLCLACSLSSTCLSVIHCTVLQPRLPLFTVSYSLSAVSHYTFILD